MQVSYQARHLRPGSHCGSRGAVQYEAWQPRRPLHRASAATAVPSTPAPSTTTAEDKWIARNVLPLVPEVNTDRLHAVATTCREALKTMRMPSARNEEFRFTDLSPLLKSSLQAPPTRASLPAALLTSLELGGGDSALAVVVDGEFRPELSRLGAVPQGVFVGGAAGAPAELLEALGEQSGQGGGPFAVLNGAIARDVLCVLAADGAEATTPLHVVHISSGSAVEGEVAASAPRLLVVARPGSSLEVVEEFVGSTAAGAAAPEGGSATFALAELWVGEGAQVTHAYVQREAWAAQHFRVTLVRQAARSSYTLTEAALGATLARHDLQITQEGEATHTRLRHFLLCGPDQLHDLHSRLELSHPEGQANQLHKCIVTSSTARGVFDGNVKVNKLAQRTDAGQLSRNLLLVPRATVNVKPNLQIVADDVRCTHGCTVSDLSADELFYFRARGINEEAARQALVYSFGAEVVRELRHEALVGRVTVDVRRVLGLQDSAAAAQLLPPVGV